jgi:hypothetical protein
LSQAEVVNPAFVDWLWSNVPIIALVIAASALCFAAFTKYLNWRDKRLQIHVELHIGPAIFRAGGASSGRDMLVVGLRNAGLPTTVVDCRFQTTARGKKYRGGDDGFEPRPLDPQDRESLMYSPAFLARALRQDGYRDLVQVRAIVADRTGASYASHPVTLDLDWALKEDARHGKATSAKGRGDGEPQESRRDP